MYQVKWVPVSQVFQGGTKEAQALEGKKVKCRIAEFSVPLYIPEHERAEVHSTNLPVSAVGWISKAVGTRVLIAFPENNHQNFQSFQALTHSGQFFVVSLDWASFIPHFFIEA